MRTSPLLLAVVSVCLWAGRVPAEYREGPVENGGTITGRVLVAGEVPKLPAQAVYKQQKVCGKSMPDQRLVVDRGGGLEQAVIALVGVAAGKPVPREQPVVLDNRKCAFVPHVTAATVGQTLEIRNSDPFLHDAHAWLGTRTLFNVGILPGHVSRQPLTIPGLIHINCNVRHTWMHAYVFVGADPYHAVTGTGGAFSIDQVPPGTYTLRVWHELLGSSERQVTVEPGQTATVNLAMPIAPAVPPAEAP